MVHVVLPCLPLQIIYTLVWVQPLGAHDAYNMPGSGLPKSDPVTHKGKTWTSSINANVWAPGVYGWIETA